MNRKLAMLMLGLSAMLALSVVLAAASQAKSSADGQTCASFKGKITSINHDAKRFKLKTSDATKTIYWDSQTAVDGGGDSTDDLAKGQKVKVRACTHDDKWVASQITIL